jgi:molecular chaperone GrpE (heat shock protein)
MRKKRELRPAIEKYQVAAAELDPNVMCLRLFTTDGQFEFTVDRRDLVDIGIHFASFDPAIQAAVTHAARAFN